LRRFVAAYGVVLVLLALIVGFSIARPDTFPTVDNLTGILALSAPSLILAAGLTIVLVMGDFDLSFGAMIGLADGVIMELLINQGVGWVASVLIVLALSAVVGLANGVMIARLGGSSFIITLAMGTILVGIEFAVTDQEQIFGELPSALVTVGQDASILGLNNQVWVAALVCLFAWFMLEKTEPGRFMRAIGGNPEAARLAGIPILTLRIAGFVLVAICAAIVGILLVSLTGQYTPNIGTSYLLPTYAGVFLGAAAFRPGEFNVAGTILGVLLLGVIQSGLTLLEFETFLINLVQGAILIAAVLLSRLGAERA
jgi:ribose transport system permease protein